MKKCSTALWCLTAALSLPAFATPTCTFLSSAPDAHLVTRGDTLWDIASRFLQNPWCWPQVWALNRDQIRNPHWIYPGQKIVFDRQLGILRIEGGDHASGAANIEKLSPTARTEPLPAASPVPFMNPRLLAMAANYRLASTADVTRAPRILGFSERRRIASAGDIALVDGRLDSSKTFDVVRALNPVIDPDDGAVLGVPLRRVGRARLMSSEGLHRFEILEVDSELMAGDLLLRAEVWPTPQLFPHAAAQIDGKVATVLQDGRWASQNDVVAINRGLRSGLDAGSVVSVMRPVRIVANDLPTKPSSQSVAALLLFAVFERTAFALVMRSNDVFSAGDAIRAAGP